MEEIFDLAWTQRKHESKRGISQAVVINPAYEDEVKELLKEMKTPTDWDIDVLKALGYQIDPEKRKPDKIWTDSEKWVPVWVHKKHLASVSFSVSRTYRAVKAKLDDVDFQTVNKIKKEIEKKKKSNEDYSKLEERLRQAKKITFRDRLEDLLRKKEVEKELREGLDKATWVIISNVLRSPLGLKASYSFYKDDDKKSSHENVRHGLNIFFCYEESHRSDAYIEDFSRHANERGWSYKDWFLCDEEPRKTKKRIRIENERQENNANKKSDYRKQKYSDEDIKKQKDLIKKLLKLADPTKNASEHEIKLAQKMAREIAEKYGIDIDNI